MSLPTHTHNLPLVSIIMNCYNGEKYLHESIRSVIQQTYPHWELVFIDNVSTDSSDTIVKSFQDPRIRYFRLESQIPLGAARNVAIQKTRGDFIAFLDTDDLWYPEKLMLQVEYFQNHPNIDFLYSKHIHFTDSSPYPLIEWLKFFSSPKPSGDVFGKFLQIYPVNLQTVMIKSKLIRDTAESFDPSLHVAEEFDLFMRLFYGCKVGYINRILVKYRIHPNQSSRSKLDLYVTESEKILSTLKERFPESAQRYSREYQFFEAKIDYYRVRGMMKKGDRQGAYQLIARHFFISWRFALLTIILKMPNFVFFSVHRISGRYI